ncbi:Uncharacterised protein [Mycoplasmopsis arginini]|nr:Uncharacterised protein [Chlamydia trachomatis]SGA02559.1 Uncharacterised protein [Chlamydia abortus]SGA10803.1 Uncharacterised protein [Mycoplasmopsis arginini]CRH55250.1 Uncharacterised protein [Chlamydia trachomatis]SGA19064.1 Uncharacterised protein [Mycoplasmopsis arginini]
MLMLALLNPSINLEYVIPFVLAAALIRAIHNFLNSRLTCFLSLNAYVHDLTTACLATL